MRIFAALDDDIHPPVTGGTQRSFGLLRGLARRHEVDALCIAPYRNRAPREQTAHGVRLHRRRAWYTALAWRAERLGLAPQQIAAAGHAAQATRWLSEGPADPDVLCVGPWLGGLLDHPGAALTVYLSQNVESDHFRTVAPRLLGRSRWARHVEAIERRLVERADRVVVCSGEDGARIRSLYGAGEARLIVAPNGYDETTLTPASAEARVHARRGLDIPDTAHVGIFLGSDAPTNRAGLELLMVRVMPTLKSGFMLIVAGGVARALAGRREPWLRVVPPVADPLPLLHAADVGLNPVITGGGSNVKVPAYLAAGLAVVSTPFGMRGYHALAALVEVAQPDELAAAWLERPLGWARTQSAMPAALASHAWGAIGERLGEALAFARTAPEAGRSAEAAQPAAGPARPMHPAAPLRREGLA